MPALRQRICSWAVALADTAMIGNVTVIPRRDNIRSLLKSEGVAQVVVKTADRVAGRAASAVGSAGGAGPWDVTSADATYDTTSQTPAMRREDELGSFKL